MEHLSRLADIIDKNKLSFSDEEYLDAMNTLKALYKIVKPGQNNNHFEFEFEFEEEADGSDDELEASDEEPFSSPLPLPPPCNCELYIHTCSFERFSASTDDNFLSKIIALDIYCSLNPLMQFREIERPFICSNPHFGSRCTFSEFGSMILLFLRFIDLNNDAGVNINARLILVISLFNYIFANFSHATQHPVFFAVVKNKLREIYNSKKEAFQVACDDILKIENPMPRWINYLESL